MWRRLEQSVVMAVVIGVVTAAPAAAQGGRGRGMMGDPAHSEDMQMFHQLFEHRADITRQVIARKDGIETITESKNPDVARLLQKHVASMLARVSDKRPIHQRDGAPCRCFQSVSDARRA